MAFDHTPTPHGVGAWFIDQVRQTGAKIERRLRERRGGRRGRSAGRRHVDITPGAAEFLRALQAAGERIETERKNDA